MDALDRSGSVGWGDGGSPYDRRTKATCTRWMWGDDRGRNPLDSGFRGNDVKGSGRALRLPIGVVRAAEAIGTPRIAWVVFGPEIEYHSRAVGNLYDSRRLPNRGGRCLLCCAVSERI